MEYVEVDWRWGMTLGTAIRDGLLASIDGETKPASRVAGELGLDERAVHAVLSALAEFGILGESGAGYRLLEEHRGPLLDDSDPDYAGGRVVHRFELMCKWSRLPEILRTGDPVEDRTRANFDGTPTMVRAMRGGAKESADQVSDIILPLLQETPNILDVGGGPGANAESFSRKGASVTVFDRPEVISLTEKYLSAAGVATAMGDMNEGLPEGPFDAVYFGNTSHMYGPEANRKLFASMRKSLKPGGILFIREFVRGVGDDAALFAVNMLVLTAEGGTYTLEEYSDWLVEAGFEDARLLEIPGRTTHLIAARNPG